ncbi:signal transduction histidine kinase/ligand-binding sensor domain-containing protein [Granulicella aggregans]|uniref:Signal transduction histidine kinase/ligand-binding sensor domain-containing protein n=1 Tax=Granulicella aggregans TaxID=474949 RepID=A0A7W8E6P9_9BACT|nr:sensor histidine kinase [Granulicella aggregans]MBB5060901.1 signal transduction histidine kinase/ligand-binding sensor domain-containing protein [Granulicella aggregans]
MKSSITSRDRHSSRENSWRWLHVLLIVFFTAGNAHALDESKTMTQYVHDRWAADRGFLGGHVYAIGESNDGYLWLGTERGLLRYDGASLVLIQRPIANSGSLGPVRDLVSDAEGSLWIRADGPRLLRYRDGRFEDMASRLSLKALTLSAMAAEHGGGVLFSATVGGIFLYRDGKVESLLRAEKVPGAVISLASTLDGAIWIATEEGGLYRTNGGIVSDVSKVVAGRKITELLPSNNGWLWAVTESGILQLESDGALKNDFSVQTAGLRALALTVDQQGNTWIGTNRGLLRVSPSRAVSSEFVDRQQENAVTAVYLDHEGVLWYGGSRGMERLRDGIFTTYTSAEGLPPTGTGPVYVDGDGRTWFAPLTGGLYWMKQGHVVRVTAGGLGEDVVNSITGCNGEIWVGRQSGGLTALKMNGTAYATRSLTSRDGLAEGSIFSVHCNRDGTIWAGTVNQGVSKVKGSQIRNFSTADGLSSNQVNSIVEGQDGTMWFATTRGLDSLVEGHWMSWTARDGLPSSEVDTLFEDSRKTLWIATSEGLAYISSESLHRPPVVPEALREQILGITEDSHGSLWFATPDHVVQVNRDGLASGSIGRSDSQLYDATDGLLGISEVRRDRAIAPDSSGHIWLALSSGLAVADPESFLSRFTPVGVRISEMSVNGIQEDMHALRSLTPGPRSITLKYDAADISAPQGLEFRYKLDGYDQGWSDIVTSRQVIYRNLGPGSYRFHVTASSGQGLWNGTEDSYLFTVEAAFWQTWWFRIACFAAIVLGSLLLYRLHMNRLTRQLNLSFQERLAERTRIARELHDTLLQSFQGLMLRFYAVDRMLPARPLDAKAALGGALDRADEALVESRNAIRSLRSSTQETRDLAQALNQIMADLNEECRHEDASTVAWSLIVEGEPREISSLISEEICRIGREALRNSLLHAQPHRIETEISYSDSHLRLRFRDDGIGIDAHILKSGGRPGHWGIPGMQERARQMQAQLKVWSKKAAGTEIEVTLPARLVYEQSPVRDRFHFIRNGSSKL